MPPDERRGMLPETWLSKMRGYAVREMEKRLQSLHLPVHDGAAMIAEERLFSETLMSVNPELWKI